MKESGLASQSDLRERASALAKIHTTGTETPSAPAIYHQLHQLSPWLDKLIEACSDPSPNLERAAGWMLDNDYQIRRAIRQISIDLPRGFFNHLPALESFNGYRYPRVLHLLQTVFYETQLQPSLSRLIQFIEAYQNVDALCEAELWAIPPLARLLSLDVLVSAVSELSESIEPPVAPIPFTPTSHVLVEEKNDALTYGVLEATDRVASSITALVVLSEIDWFVFVDKTSKLDALLATDPAKSYARMDRETRSRYRSEVEMIARQSACTELQVAAKVLELAKKQENTIRQSHVGYWLIDAGRVLLEENVGARCTWKQKLKRFSIRHAGIYYALSLIGITVLSLLLPGSYLLRNDATVLPITGILLLALFPASVIAISLFNWIATRLISPSVLPALDSRFGVPEGFATAIVVPVIVGSASEVKTLIERLELRQLANPEVGLCYVLLSDPVDADVEVAADDAGIESAMVEGIRSLNKRYPIASGDRFLLLHRHRQFNDAEGCWMAEERKRGKLEQFCALLIDGWSQPFVLTEGNLESLNNIRFAISLDADTMLPPGSAVRLVCKLAHPLNQAVFDAATGKVSAGYTVLQPRIETLTKGESSTEFAQLFAGDSAIDIYSRAVSDVYQDLFAEGSYVGKGIFDVRAFHLSLANRVPDNAILSHDLFEGLHGRVALTTDIVLYEDYPETWPEYVARQHRWIRGDWQLLPWTGTQVPTVVDRQERSRFTLLDRWKLIDNLRRSLVPVAMLMFFLGGWYIFPGSAWVWTLLAVASFAPYLINEAFATLSQLSRRRKPRGFAHRGRLLLGRWVVSIAFLVVEAMIALDAIVRTLWRVYVSRRHLLQWKPAAHMQSATHGKNISNKAWRLMWPSPFFAVIVAVGLYWYNSSAILPAMPVLVVWFFAPLLATRLGKPREFRRDSLMLDEQQFLRSAARRTWHFFDTFCAPEDNWLPPDNFQSHPGPLLAHRTSPTNIGLYMTSVLAAHDLGFIGALEFSIRLRNVLDAMDRLPQHRGHLLNWYDTRTLEPLEPRYVSTVDSGNLAVCLLAIKQGCIDLAETALADKVMTRGLGDTLQVLVESLHQLDRPISSEVVNTAERLKLKLEGIAGNCIHVQLPQILTTDWPMLEQLIADELVETKALQADTLTDIHIWLERFDHQLRATIRDINELMPWLNLLESVPVGCHALAKNIENQLSPNVTLNQQQGLGIQCKQLIDVVHTSNVAGSKEAAWYAQMYSAIDAGCDAQAVLLAELESVAMRADKIAYGMDFSWLFDQTSRLFHIGYNLSSGVLDANHYDLLASEARLASFFAIAKHDVPLEHWFYLGRPIVRHDGQPAVQSWNGSMFEYLMPPLFLPGKRDTLLGESESVAVRSQRAHAKSRDVPWGVSESAFAVTDAEGNYQYRAFGTPGLGIRRGLSDDLVVAPYASMLALGVWPVAAVKNLRALASMGASGRYGFIDALDFTAERIQSPMQFFAVRTWMAHHQGMSLVAIVNVLMQDCMPRRVLNEKSMRAVELLLQERIPWDAPTENTRTDESVREGSASALPSLPNPWIPTAADQLPQIQLLGNGRMSARVSFHGGGGLFYRDISLTRWTPDAAHSGHGYRIHFADQGSAENGWLGGAQHHVADDDAMVIFGHQKIEMIRRLSRLTLRLEIVVAAHDDIDIRRITVTNERNENARIELTSFAEVSLAAAIDVERHPAFSKLFIGSRREEAQHGVSFMRRPRDSDSQSPFMLHRVIMEDEGAELTGIETDRLQWLGRLGDANAPAALSRGLSGTTGWTLDPVMALQVGILLRPGETRQIAFLTMAGDTRSAVLERSAGMSLVGLDRLFADVALDAAQELRRLELDPASLPSLQNLASLIIYPHPVLRAVPGGLFRVKGGQPDLWPFGISGDLSVLLLRMDDEASPELLDTLLRAQGLWRRRGLLVDLVVLRTGPASYEEPLRQRILDTLRDADSYGWLGRDGGVHLLSESNMTVSQIGVLEAFASVVLDNDQSLADRLDDVLLPKPVPPKFEATGAVPYDTIDALAHPAGLLFGNGFGGFDPATGEYVIHLEPGETTPSPWCNVLANEQFGSIVSEAGPGFSWGLNSGEHRLTTWSNDPVADTPGEMLYLRDETTAEIWSVTPASNHHDSATQIRHGFGYTSWCRNSHGLEQELLAFVDVGDPVKLLRLKLVNRSGQPRRLTVTYYAEWMMGAIASRARSHVVTDYDASCEAIIATNTWNHEFAGRVAFLSANQSPHSVTGNRLDFLGDDGNIMYPAGLCRSDLGGGFTPGADACAAYQVHIDIPADASKEVIFVLGEAGNVRDVAALVSAWRSGAQIDEALARLRAFWDRLTKAVQVHTPDAGFDLMVNRWLVYQNVSSRLLARAGYYQTGGAFGFRDQLQDVLSLLPSDPARVRRQILLAAKYQFEEGDVLHWWHPPGGRGVRTRITDDRLWLAWVSARYIEATGDWTVLDVSVPFLRGLPLEPQEHDRYAGFETGRYASLYEHCCRALECSMATGIHGLPLIGTGDWNDGMDRVGPGGRGESVWLAWFQISVINALVPLAEYQGETERIIRWQQHAKDLKIAIDTHAWDGRWYIRAFDDKGHPWGSIANDECQIDSIAQSWGALAGFGTEERVASALNSAQERLVDQEHRIVRLLTPPFHDTQRNPGYIKAYPPGVRENGGQYTHAAAWLGLAFANIGDGDSAYRIFDYINPIGACLDRESAIRYAREPYVLCGDVSGSSQNAGRGGWSWYTGAAGWTWQLAVHGILGIHYRPAGVRVEPCLPKSWDHVEIMLDAAHGGTIALRIENPERVGCGIARISVDGVVQDSNEFDFPDNSDITRVVIRLGKVHE